MSETVVQILKKENCLNCSNNCKGFCAGIREQLNPDNIANGVMQCELNGNKQFQRILTDYELEYIETICVTTAKE